MKIRLKQKKLLVGIPAALMIMLFMVIARNSDLPQLETAQGAESEPGSQLAAVGRILFSGEPPYLTELPILDNNLYVRFDNELFLFGGVDISLIRYSAGTGTGGKPTIQDREDHIEFIIAERPYIEFSYKDNFYSIEAIGRIYSNRMELREISRPTIALNNKFGGEP